MESTYDTPTVIAALTELGMISTDVTAVALIVKKDQHALYRITHVGSSSVLKLFNDTTARELAASRLLQRYGVPTLPVYGMSERALLMADLAASTAWRLATAEDIEREKTGIAVAAWYTALHTAGERIVRAGIPAFLTREVASLTPESVMDTGERLGLSHLPVWRSAAEHLDRLVQAFRAYPETLNYNDFHWTNLALSRGEPLRALVFDYHLLGIGPAYCDLRNVLGSLGERARAAFSETYGPVDERVAVLDAPLSLLYSLHVAAQLPQWPGWAKGCVRHVVSGEFAVRLQQAIDASSLSA